MAKEKTALISFAERCTGFNQKDKLKIILVAAGVKPATYIRLKIEKNLHDKHTFDDLLKAAGFHFKVSRPKGYEEIVNASKKRAKWKFRGTWYGYDIFRTEKEKKKFEKYKKMLKARHKQADILAGEVYGYPKCCVKRFVKELDLKWVARNYSYYEFYKRLHDTDKAFPYIQHTPCSAKCKKSVALNKKYKDTARKHAKKFYKEFTKKVTQNIPLVINTFNDLTQNDKSIWKEKDGHDYVLVTLRPIDKKYFLVSWLTKKEYRLKTMVEAEVTVQHENATVKKVKEIGFAKDFHHERHFTV